MLGIVRKCKCDLKIRILSLKTWMAKDHFTYLPQKRLSTSGFQETPLITGLMRERLVCLEQKKDSPDIRDMMLTHVKSPEESLELLSSSNLEVLRFLPEEKMLEFATVEFPLDPKLKTSIANANLCGRSTPTLRLSRTLDPALTSRGKVFSLYSEEQLMEISKQLWFPIETDLPGSDLSCSNGCLESMESTSWYSNKALVVKNTSYVRTCSPSSTYFPVELTELGDTLKSSKRKRKKNLNSKLPPILRFVECCEFVVSKKIKGTVYGRPCGNVLVEGESKCPKHTSLNEGEYEKFWPYCCQAIIPKLGTGISKERSKKDLKCGDFCPENENYCKKHKKTCSKPKPEYRNMRCLKIRARPSLAQRKVLERFFGGSRKTYNIIVEERLGSEFSGRITKKEKTELESVYKQKYVTNCPEYLKKVPKDIRSNAVEEYFTSTINAWNMKDKKESWERYKKLNNKNYNEKPVKLPELTFKKKLDQQSIHLPSAGTSVVNLPGKTYPPGIVPEELLNPTAAIRIYPTFLVNPIRLDRRAKYNKTLTKYLNTNILYDYRLIKTKSLKYYFCFPYSATKTPTTSTKQASCDPGIRTFQTVYSPQGELHQYGTYANDKINLYNIAISTLKQQYFKGTLKYHAKLKKLRLLLQDKLKNIVTDLHNKTAKALCSSFKTIILPRFGSQQTYQTTKALSTRTKLEMRALAHSTFTHRLISKAELMGCEVIVPPNEFRTTMTCGYCFSINLEVGSSEVYTCNSCGLTSGRDVNAARNIFIRQLTL